MTEAFDIVIRGGTIVDGTGSEPFVGDIAIAGDLIAAVGSVAGRGKQEIDASGLLVTPGFVDIHTHYDGQVIWESRLSPSSGHGVTTVVMGNCGIGFAPCREQDREKLVRLMEGVEDIPGIVMTEGLTWEWETYPQYLDAVASRQHDINVASYFPHSPLRVYVMGDRAMTSEAATDADIARMAELAREAIDAGAVGFSSSRTLFHRSSTGERVPTLCAREQELVSIAGALQEADRGILQIATDYDGFTDIQGEFSLLERVARGSGRDLTLPMAQSHSKPEQWRELMTCIEGANASGVRVTGQMLPRGIGMLFGLELTMNPFCLSPTYIELTKLPLGERVERLRDPAVRAQLLAEAPNETDLPSYHSIRDFGRMFEMGTSTDYEPTPEMSIAKRAEAAGKPALEFAYDLMLEHNGTNVLFMPFANYAHGNLDAVLELLKHPDIVLGLGDGGAHYGIICDASYTSHLLTHWTRDRQRGERIALVEAVRSMTSETAETIGLLDRGVLAAGYRADVNIIDYESLQLHAPSVAYDLPAGGRRLSQNATGFVATIVNGVVVYRHGEATGALPGALVRGSQPQPEQVRDSRPESALN